MPTPPTLASTPIQSPSNSPMKTPASMQPARRATPYITMGAARKRGSEVRAPVRKRAGSRRGACKRRESRKSTWRRQARRGRPGRSPRDRRRRGNGRRGRTRPPLHHLPQFGLGRNGRGRAYRDDRKAREQAQLGGTEGLVTRRGLRHCLDAEHSLTAIDEDRIPFRRGSMTSGRRTTGLRHDAVREADSGYSPG